MSILLLAFQFKPVQTWAAKYATDYLSDELHTKVSVKSLYIRPFTSVVLEGLYVLDKKQDTLLSTPTLAVDIKGFSLLSSINERTINFESIELDNGSFYLKKQKDSTTNLKFIIDYFNSGDTTKKTPGKPWTLNFDKIAINNFHFRYKNQLIDTVENKINFNDLDVSHFSTVVTGMDIKNHLFKGHVQHLTLQEKSGFYVKNFTANATIDTNQVLLRKLTLQTRHSDLKDYFRMRFRSFDDLDDFENKVNMDADFKASRISSTDIAYFTSGMGKTTFDLGIEGRVKGLVNNLKSKNVTISGGQATFIRGDFNLRGLPDWDNTFLELKFDQVASNKKDLDYLISHFSGSPNMQVPAIIGKFGNINFTGRFTGLQNDFVAYGIFKTGLGRFDSDINLKIDKKGTPSYSGKLDAFNFDLGTLLDENTLGRTTFNADVKGSGDALKNLGIKVNANINTIDFKGYTYNKLTVNGSFIKKLADGHITINDRNLKLDLKGSVNLNPTLPVYDLAATIKDARLNKLKLIKDTITISTTLKTAFSGNQLDNIQGNVLFSPARVVDPRNNYLVDSLYLSSTGSGNNREINLRSDFADASIKGKFDLATLPSYYKTIAKKYIPSIKTTIVTPKPEQFAFNLTLKNLDPLTAIFLPDLKIPDQGTFVGQFDSENKTATLSGYIKTIKYGKTVFHDFIIDENTTDSLLGLNLSLSKVDLTDSLFIKDINITNFLKNDSLNFNVKLSDKNAVNQLDLYGLVEFGRDTTAKLKLLPSDIILEKEKWKIQEQVRIRLLDGKTQVSGFELSNGLQKVHINGFISDNPADELKLSFEKFNMRTLNQLTRTSGIYLNGSLNGDVNFTSIIKSPGVDAHLTIDSLSMNKTLIGNVKLVSTLGNDRKQANMNLNILNRGLETMNIAGIYAFGHDTDDNLDFDVKMNQTEAIIFEPFIKDLVSDVKGHISTDLKLTGKPSNPQLNGSLTLENTGVTVNYLKTAYTVNNKLSVNNSVINISNMVLKDIKGGTGTANGTVDLNNLDNPNIQVVLDARNLMALNTTFKDNHIYYGTAFGTGKFSFKGPVDNMKIDITARTEAGTIFNIPLNTSSTASEYDFIKFVSHKDTVKETAKERAFNGVTLNFDLSADEKTIVKITTDYGLLEGSGVANNLKLNINSLGDFEMYGDFLISSGKFEFTAKNFISKNFTVSQGGTIRWTGNPSNAEINLRALYEVRTSKGPLYAAAGLQTPTSSQQTLVQAQLILTKSLLQPVIDFDFNFPTDPSVKDDLATYLADNNNRSQQAISIIVRRTFSSNNNNLTNQVLGTAGEAVSEFAFNKLNSLISQSNIKNFDLNIRSFSEASASLRFFNNRLSFNGSLFSNNGSNDLFNNNNSSLFNQKFNALTKDFEALYQIRKDGNLTARYSYRALNNTTLSSLGGDQLIPQYVNGLGLVYTRDFDTFGEFIRNIFRRSRRDRAPITPNPIPTTTGGTPNPTKPEDDDTN
ncbi:translocation/assembly module TamB domain-containing protein [Mucilaginibacter sabulilitoris]|uniref:Translocation/assembly module TamB domain-containing protein n=1 Tax=Mucilaginibacter sabulilitoris TaxID=1173583 RepID=A0ABZ0TL86_9SPHI|nr:translocation/assembly module TamB domain-containing protein [Mucilaginibacter sabulilitoris]WPU93579.1 translocation/assembly module TamB domain-containing protein [Mucilaginibacter sabulilitoris]